MQPSISLNSKIKKIKSLAIKFSLMFLSYFRFVLVSKMTMTTRQLFYQAIPIPSLLTLQNYLLDWSLVKFKPKMPMLESMALFDTGSELQMFKTTPALLLITLASMLPRVISELSNYLWLKENTTSMFMPLTKQKLWTKDSHLWLLFRSNLLDH